MKLKKQPFWDLTLCPWVSSSDIPMYRIAFIFIIRLCKNIFYRQLESEGESTVIPWNSRSHAPNNTVSHPRRHKTSATQLWKSKILQGTTLFWQMLKLERN